MAVEYNDNFDNQGGQQIAWKQVGSSAGSLTYVKTQPNGQHAAQSSVTFNGMDEYDFHRSQDLLKWAGFKYDPQRWIEDNKYKHSIIISAESPNDLAKIGSVLSTKTEIWGDLGTFKMVNPVISKERVLQNITDGIIRGVINKNELPPELEVERIAYLTRPIETHVENAKIIASPQKGLADNSGAPGYSQHEIEINHPDGEIKISDNVVAAAKPNGDAGYQYKTTLVTDKLPLNFTANLDKAGIKYSIADTTRQGDTEYFRDGWGGERQPLLTVSTHVKSLRPGSDMEKFHTEDLDRLKQKWGSELRSETLLIPQKTVRIDGSLPEVAAALKEGNIISDNVATGITNSWNQFNSPTAVAATSQTRFLQDRTSKTEAAYTGESIPHTATSKKVFVSSEAVAKQLVNEASNMGVETRAYKNSDGHDYVEVPKNLTQEQAGRLGYIAYEGGNNYQASHQRNADGTFRVEAPIEGVHAAPTNVFVSSEVAAERVTDRARGMGLETEYTKVADGHYAVTVPSKLTETQAGELGYIAYEAGNNNRVSHQKNPDGTFRIEAPIGGLAEKGVGAPAFVEIHPTEIAAYDANIKAGALGGGIMAFSGVKDAYTGIRTGDKTQTATGVAELGIGGLIVKKSLDGLKGDTESASLAGTLGVGVTVVAGSIGAVKPWVDGDSGKKSAGQKAKESVGSLATTGTMVGTSIGAVELLGGAAELGAGTAFGVGMAAPVAVGVGAGLAYKGLDAANKAWQSGLKTSADAYENIGKTTNFTPNANGQFKVDDQNNHELAYVLSHFPGDTLADKIAAAKHAASAAQPAEILSPMSIPTPSNLTVSGHLTKIAATAEMQLKTIEAISKAAKTAPKDVGPVTESGTAHGDASPPIAKASPLPQNSLAPVQPKPNANAR